MQSVLWLVKVETVTLAPRLVRERFVFIKKMQSIQRMAPVQSKHPPLLTRQQGSRLARDLEARVAVPTTVTSKFHSDLPGITHRDLPGMTHRDNPGMTQVFLHWSKLENASYAKICIPKLQLYWYTGKKKQFNKNTAGGPGCEKWSNWSWSRAHSQLFFLFQCINVHCHKAVHCLNGMPTHL